jgi:hypothetical protein
MTDDLKQNHLIMNQTISDITPDAISTMRSEFKDGDIVMVAWRGPLPLSRCDFCYVEDDTTTYSGLTFGIIYDRPEFREVIIHPHMVVVPPGVEDDDDFGEVAIPYSSIESIMLLLSTSIGLRRKQTTSTAD